MDSRQLVDTGKRRRVVMGVCKHNGNRARYFAKKKKYPEKCTENVCSLNENTDFSFFFKTVNRINMPFTLYIKLQILKYSLLYLTQIFPWVDSIESNKLAYPIVKLQHLVGPTRWCKKWSMGASRLASAGKQIVVCLLVGKDLYWSKSMNGSLNG